VKYFAPAGTAIGPHTAAIALLSGLSSKKAHAELASALARHAGRDRAFLMSTGRAGMSVALQAMRQLHPDRTEVLVPGYTCYSVPASVKLAGLTPRLIDIDANTLSPDLTALDGLDTSRVLALVTANLYGIPNQLRELEAFARSRGILMLDDAAQALGATLGGRNVGGFGDAGLYSFDKGKNITSIEGGAITASGVLAGALDARCASLVPTSAVRTAMTSAKLLVYSTMLRPTAYGLVNKLPLGLGTTRWEDDYPLGAYSPVLAAVALRLYRQLDRLTRTRTVNARALREALADVPGIRLPAIAPDANPAWVRFVMFMDDPARRGRAVAALNAAGIGATVSYPQALVDVPEARALLAGDAGAQEGARNVAASVVTLPTHAYVPEDLGSRVRAILAAI
jgi:perosamine synthetase